jgi:hypothetical protein
MLALKATPKPRSACGRLRTMCAQALLDASQLCMFLTSLFQELVSNFAINVLLLQKASINEKNMGVKIL